MTTTFKAGDRVRAISTDGMIAVGQEYAVVVSDRSYTTVRLPSGSTRNCFTTRFELVAPAVTAAPAPTTGPAKIDLSDLKPGDKVTLTLTATVKSGPDMDGDVEVEGEGSGLFGGYLWARTTYVGTVDQSARPLNVGDAVKTLSGTSGTIKALVDGKAWVAMSNGGHTVRDVVNLRRA